MSHYWKSRRCWRVNNVTHFEVTVHLDVWLDSCLSIDAEATQKISIDADELETHGDRLKFQMNLVHKQDAHKRVQECKA